MRGADAQAGSMFGHKRRRDRRCDDGRVPGAGKVDDPVDCGVPLCRARARPRAVIRTDAFVALIRVPSASG